MQFFATTVAFLAAAMTTSAAPAFGSSFTISASKDATIGMSQNSYYTAQGTAKTLYASNKPDNVSEILIGFSLPDQAVQNSNYITKCTLDLPFFQTPGRGLTKIMAIRAEGSWDEARVSGANKPAKVGGYSEYAIDSNEDFKLDVTVMCKEAGSQGGELSFYIASPDVPYTAASREGGRPAVLDFEVYFPGN
ncbi:hypothetical protein EC988_002184 [Linderina pennispora]|nr:hypothetical protein EC988_002184 [Linderina pennispora]